MNTVIFLSSKGQRQQIAYSVLENIWDNKQITCLYKHTSSKMYNRWPDSYDLGINFLYPYSIPTEELSKAPWINFHIGQLPEYGGHNTAYHAIINKSNEFGATIHYISSQFDEVSILESTRFMIEPQYTAKDLTRKSKDTLLLLFIKWIPILCSEIIETEVEKIEYYPPTNIPEKICISDFHKQLIKAITSENREPKIDISGTTYLIKKS